MKQLFYFFVFAIAFSSCKKNKAPNCYPIMAKGRIIGYHPCADYVQAKRTYGAGFVLEIDNDRTKDTVVSFQIPEGIFTFKPEYLYSSYLFRPEVQDSFKIDFTYKLAADHEKTTILLQWNDEYSSVRCSSARQRKYLFHACQNNN